MKRVRGRVEGNTIIKHHTRLDGIVVGSTEVSKNKVLALYGEIIGDLTVKKDARVRLYGMVNGNVLNEGGQLEVFGIVGGGITRKGGKTTINSGAIVLGDIE